jgi:CheY-like chemotaxis protein
MPQGGMLDISAEEVTVERAAEGLAAGQYLRLSLADTGLGMDTETLARAPDPFFTTKGVGKGTGLGLSMVQGLAAQSGGKLALRSIVGRGTTVELFLPLAPPVAKDPAKEEAPVMADPGPARTILVVDDDRLVRANTAAMLEDLGHDVCVAASGAEALSLIDKAPRLDLVLTDQLMPGMTGVQVIHAARARRPQLKFLLMSGFAELGPEEADDRPILAKPFRQAQLAAAVRDATISPKVIQLRRG